MKRFFALAVLLLVSALSFADDNPPPHAIKVTGTADVKVAPDQATIDIGIEKQNSSATAAKRAADKGAREILAVLHTSGIPDKDVSTNWLSLNPQYNWQSGKINSFVAEQSLTVVVRDLSKLEDLLDALIKAGGNRISSVRFETSELRKYRDEARDAAVTAAREKAQALAKALGQSIGKAISVEEVAQSANPYAFTYGYLANATLDAQMAKSPSGPANAPGERKVSASVTVWFELM